MLTGDMDHWLWVIWTYDPYHPPLVIWTICLSIFSVVCFFVGAPGLYPLVSQDIYAVTLNRSNGLKQDMLIFALIGTICEHRI